MRVRLTLILLFLNGIAFTQNRQGLLHLQYGKYSVGLTQEKIRYHDSVEILISVWQPAIFSKNSIPLSLKDCFQLDGLGKPEITDSAANDIICGDNYRINGDTLKTLLNTKTNTSRNYLPVKKKFPAICWGSRHGTEYYQFAMSEYLASHGYIVFTVSRISPALPFPWQIENISKEGFLDQHLEMIDQQLQFIKSHPQADTSKIAMFTWSYGSPFAILAQQQNQEIDAVFGFSAVDFRQEYFLEDVFSKRLKPGQLHVPYFLFYEEISRLNIQYDSSVLHTAHRDISKLYVFPNLWHGNFNYAEGYLPGLLDLPKVHPWSKSGKDAVMGYETITELALIYLDNYFKKDLSIQKRISHLKNKLPKNFLTEVVK